MVSFNKWPIVVGLGGVALFPLAQAADVEFRALISDISSHCSIALPETTLSFVPLQADKLIGGVTTYQIQPLRVDLLCHDVTQNIAPSITFQGNTPYSQSNTLFLDGSANGVGFMLRQDQGARPSLAEFYDTNQAIASNGPPLSLTTLDTTNNYYHEETFWVGLVGPLNTPVISGNFQATLTVNVAFQ
uniref:Fimbrial protein n=1 Tax=Providencia stuartii TaxID=588 RepID=A0AAI9DFY6_PROST|nr:fimbrial protein [Providencia stuartii]